VPERRVEMTDGLAERVVRRAIAALANSYANRPERSAAAKEMLVHVLQGDIDEADEVDGYAAAAAMTALAHGIEAEAGRGLDWLSVAALEEWDFHHPESPI
jgi:predicted lipid-binding transport protein (Tim44 family)